MTGRMLTWGRNLLRWPGSREAAIAVWTTGASLMGRMVAAALMLSVAAFCLLGVAPMAATDAGCDGHHASAKVCGQSGFPEPLLGVVPHVPPVPRIDAPAAWVSVALPSDPVLRFQATPSSPRAPPLAVH